MAKLYWSTSLDAESWARVESIEEAVAEAREAGLDCPQIWVAPVSADCDDDQAFWDALADHLLVWGVESAEESLVEDGFLDPEESWISGTMPKDTPARVVAKALREALGPRPEWRTVDTSRAKLVPL